MTLRFIPVLAAVVLLIGATTVGAFAGETSTRAWSVRDVASRGHHGFTDWSFVCRGTFNALAREAQRDGSHTLMFGAIQQCTSSVYQGFLLNLYRCLRYGGPDGPGCTYLAHAGVQLSQYYVTTTGYHRCRSTSTYLWQMEAYNINANGQEHAPVWSNIVPVGCS